jgi:hypothetical protein
MEVLWIDGTKASHGRRNVAQGDHDMIRAVLKNRKKKLQLCMINPDTKIKSCYVPGDSKNDRLNGEKIKMFRFDECSDYDMTFRY